MYARKLCICHLNHPVTNHSLGKLLLIRSSLPIHKNWSSSTQTDILSSTDGCHGCHPGSELKRGFLRKGKIVLMKDLL